MTFSGILFICALVVSFAALALREGRKLFIIINKQDQAISRMQVLIIQAR